MKTLFWCWGILNLMTPIVVMAVYGTLLICEMLGYADGIYQTLGITHNRPMVIGLGIIAIIAGTVSIYEASANIRHMAKG